MLLVENEILDLVLIGEDLRVFTRVLNIQDFEAVLHVAEKRALVLVQDYFEYLQGFFKGTDSLILFDVPNDYFVIQDYE